MRGSKRTGGRRRGHVRRAAPIIGTVKRRLARTLPGRWYRRARRIRAEWKIAKKAAREDGAALKPYRATWAGVQGLAKPLTLLPPSVPVRHLHHVGPFTASNAGDTLLPVVLRDLFDLQLGPSRWSQHQVPDAPSGGLIRRFNRSAGLVIGGGGLFIGDTHKNDVSGWQWPVSTAQLRRITAPLIVFAVGYNRFRGQAEFAGVFQENVTTLLERSGFFGLRNHGSIAAIKQYVPESLHDRIRFQPCMTTLISKIYPERVATESREEPFIALNVAFDRAESRFGADGDQVIRRLVEAVGDLSSDIPVKYYAHMPRDLEFSAALDRAGVRHEVVALYGRSPQQVIEAYVRPSLAIGMRGHAQMVPFGCGTPILTLASHDKMRWFLQDIGHDEWGVEVADLDSRDRIVVTARQILGREAAVRAEIGRASRELWSITEANLRQIDAALTQAS